MGDQRNTKSSELDRSTSRRASTRLSRLLRDGDDDDYDFQAMAISDGFRPAHVAENHVSHVARPSLSSLEPPVARAMSPRPSSVSKPAIGHEPLFSVSYNGLERAPARSSSVSTDSPVITAETPYEGPRGPSHPYQMYPQDVRVARTASLATTSTAPVSERSYTGPSRPTHPYGIYPQNVGTGDDGLSDRSPPRDINVGFPGTADNYQRRIGPDGEEAADMIGPDGHTEQLPPYTRYPMEAYAQKTPAEINVAQSVSTSSTAQQPVQNLEIPGAGGIGLATRNPEFSSTEDLNQLNSPQSRRSVRSFASEASHHSINTAALAVTNEKETSNWRTTARRKVWGVVPCWALVLGAIVVLLLGVVVGTVLGTVIGPQLRQNGHHEGLPDSTTGLPGYVPLTTAPPGLPPLAEGEYALPLMSPRFSQTCFQDTSQGKAWNCDAILSQLTMSVHRKPGSNDLTTYTLDINFNHSYTVDSFVYSYGVQPPLLFNQQLELVNDSFERSRGPAWAFAIPYNKTIILPEEFLTYTPSEETDKVQRRMMFGFDFKRKGLAQSGERPWICTWPETILEMFIYAGQNNSFKYPTPPSTPPPTTSSTGAQSTNVHRRDGKGGDPSDYDSRKEEGFPHTHPPTQRPTSSETSSSASSPTTQTSSAGPDWFSPPPMPPPPFAPYPKVVKVEERRDPEIGAPAPTCRQVEIIDKGIKAQPVYYNGEPVVVNIAEVMPENEDKEMNPYFKRGFGPYLWNRGDDSSGNELSSCGCIWWLT